MTNITSSLQFLLNIAKIQAVVSRKFDGQLGGGIGFNDFMILFHLSLAPDNQLRRIDLAQQIGLTASGVTRLLAPMEKVGLIKKEINKHDARVSLVSLTKAGNVLLNERIENAERLSQEIIPSSKQDQLDILIDLITKLSISIH